MKIYDLIEEKKRGDSLFVGEIAYMVYEFVAEDIPGYQMSAMLVAVYFEGMDGQEIIDLTLEVAHSGDMVDLPPIEGIRADRHSTDGVGDKMILVTGPIVTAYGVKMAKVGGWGLGHAGGIVDELESTPGFEIAIPREEFFRIVDESGLTFIGQSGNMVLADKELYVPRDVTIIVDSIPLIIPSVMSKELTTGSDCIVLNVRTGSGASMKSLEKSISLTREMISIGTLAERCRYALITNMGVPLGHVIGNPPEMEEATGTLEGRGPKSLTCVSLEPVINMSHMIGKRDMGQYRGLAEGVMKNKNVLQCLKSVVESQGGDGRYVEHPDLFVRVSLGWEVKTPKAGCTTHMDTEGIGAAFVILGVGRNKKGDATDYSAGIFLRKKYGGRVEVEETVVVLYASHEDLFGPIVEKFPTSYTLEKQKPEPEPLIFARASDAGTERGTIEEKIP